MLLLNRMRENQSNKVILKHGDVKEARERTMEILSRKVLQANNKYEARRLKHSWSVQVDKD